MQNDQIELPHHWATVFRFKLRPDLTADELRHVAERLKAVQAKYFNRYGVIPEIEREILADLESGRFPRPLLARVGSAINRDRPATQPPREPGREDVKRYVGYYGRVAGDGELAVYYPNRLHRQLPQTDESDGGLVIRLIVEPGESVESQARRATEKVLDIIRSIRIIRQ